MPITDFLNSRGFFPREGHVGQCSGKVEDLIELTKRPNLIVMEIGFNAGNSAEVFLQNNDSLELISFDINMHNYVLTAKKYIDVTYPKRHLLILGDSRISVPAFINKNPNIKFDVIFIDGGHDYETAKTDIENCFHLAHKDTIVILDDTIYRTDWIEDWTLGPTRVWLEYIAENKIIEIKRKEYSRGLGMSWGKICN